MSYRRAMTLYCDRDGCTSTITLDGLYVAGDARKEARKQGWSFNGQLDLCKKHTK